MAEANHTARKQGKTHSAGTFEPDLKRRCPWARSGNEIRYHDTEWGVPCHDDRVLFEFLLLEGAQAGLSWSTILDKRERYRQAFDDFDPACIAAYTQRKTNALLKDSGIVRNRLKIAAAVKNAQCFLKVQSEWGTFDRYIWQFCGGRPCTPACSTRWGRTCTWWSSTTTWARRRT